MNTCSDCLHWHRHPADPANLSAPARGDCREGPPHLTLLPGPGGAMIQLCGYPTTAAGFPACGHFTPRPQPPAKTAREELAALEAEGKGDTFHAEELRSRIAFEEKMGRGGKG